MRLIKEDGHFILKSFHELFYTDISDTDVLRCFLEANDVLLFGVTWRELDLDNLENEEMDPILKEAYQQLLPFFDKDPEIEKKHAEDKQFIDSRTVFTNQDWPMPWTKPNKEIKEIQWYRPHNEEEIKRAIDIDKRYTCVLLDKDSPFESYSYALSYFEEEDGASLMIIEKKEHNFVQRVLPRLRTLLNGLASLDIE